MYFSFLKHWWGKWFCILKGLKKTAKQPEVFNTNYMVERRSFYFSAVLNLGSLGKYLSDILIFLSSSVVTPKTLNVSNKSCYSFFRNSKDTFISCSKPTWLLEHKTVFFTHRSTVAWNSAITQRNCRKGAKTWSSIVKLEFLLLLTIFHFIKKFTTLDIMSVNDLPVYHSWFRNVALQT